MAGRTSNHPFLGQVAVITGSSSGIGRSLARALADAGCRVGLVSRRRAELDILAEEIRLAGGTSAVAVADVGSREQIKQAIDDIASVLGPIDLMVANAGVGVPTTLDPVNIKAVEETIRVNVLGVIYSIDAVLPSMLERSTGQIAAISSLAAYKGMPGESAYCASKAAVNAYLEGLRVQVRSRGISVSTICPGFVRTPMTAPNGFSMPFVLEADQAAQRIVKALARRAQVYNFPWQTVALMKLVGWAPDWAMALAFRDYLAHPPMPEVQTSAEVSVE
jgi:short-subunit dehydrogenase